MGAYRDELAARLAALYANRRFGKYYRPDTILIGLAQEEDIDHVYHSFCDVLRAMPEIDHPKERVEFFFQKDKEWKFYSLLINPNERDLKVARLAGTFPGGS
jgi:hypothetical protein